jgi:hypothetical protein
MSKNVLESERLQMTMWRRDACWFSKVTRAQAQASALVSTLTPTHARNHTHVLTHTHTHTQKYIRLIAIYGHSGSANAPQCYVIRPLLVLLLLLRNLKTSSNSKCSEREHCAEILRMRVSHIPSRDQSCACASLVFLAGLNFAHARLSYSQQGSILRMCIYPVRSKDQSCACASIPFLARIISLAVDSKTCARFCSKCCHLYCTRTTLKGKPAQTCNLLFANLSV